MTSRRKQLEFFMLHEDEEEFSFNLKNEFKEIVFFDDNVWEDSPEMVDSIDKCQTGYCYIWNRTICPDLPTIQRKDGQIQGPSSGIVIQFQRCRIDENKNLLSGRIAIGYDSANEELHEFVSSVWRILKKTTIMGVFHAPTSDTVDSSKIIKEFGVGKTVKSALVSKKVIALKHRSTENFYVPAM